MEIKKLAAAFGQREPAVLDLAPGLNIIKTPSEASTAAWTAFLEYMLYGPDPGGPPRSAAAHGHLETATVWGPITVARWTAAPEAPMGAFSAVYTGGIQPVAHLTAANCGEALLGVPRAVFDRRALVRAPAPADGTAALEELRSLTGVLAEDQTEYALLQDRAAQLQEQLDRHDKADRREAALAAENAHLDFVSARDKVKTMEASQKTPPSKAQLTALRSALDHLEAQSGPIQQARQRMEQAARAEQFALSALDAQEPAKPKETEPPPKPSWQGACWSLLAGVVMGIIAFVVYRNWLLAAGIGVGLFAVLAALTVIGPLTREKKEWAVRHGELSRQRTKEESAYAALAQNAGAARAAHQEAEAAYHTLKSNYKDGLEQALALVHSFRPFAKDLADARQAVADGMLLRRELDDALLEEAEARQRWEALQQEAVYALQPPVKRPAEGREWLRRELADATAQLDILQARFTETLEKQAEELYARLSQTHYRPGETLAGDAGRQMYLAAQLAMCGLALPGTVPLLLEGALDCLDGDGLTAALDCLTGLSQTRQVLLVTCMDREASCLRRTHPDRFYLIKI